MKRIIIAELILSLVLLISAQGHTALYNRGIDSLGNRLIYDSELNITWYDFTNAADTWQNQVDWAGALTVNFGSTIFDDWRLPLTVDGPYVEGYDGTTTAGYNITTSEMGHLFYTELVNTGAFDTLGNLQSCGYTASCLTNTGNFQNLQSNNYWSGTEYSNDTAYAWFFGFNLGRQNIPTKDVTMNAIAVRAGDVAVVPEPVSTILFISGGTLLAGRRFIKRRKTA